MGLKKRIRAARKVLTKKYFTVYTSNGDANKLMRDAIRTEAAKLVIKGVMSKERYQMIASILFDRSVILQSIHHQDKDKYVPTVIYDCESEEDFQELKEQEIE